MNSTFSSHLPMRVWQSQQQQGEVNRRKPLQITDVPPSKPTRLEEFTLKLAITQCHSMWIHAPDVGPGVPVVRLTLEGGQELPPFLFYHGGVGQLFHAIRLVTHVTRDASDPCLYILHRGDAALSLSSCSTLLVQPSPAEPETPGNPQTPPVAVAATAAPRTPAPAAPSSSFGVLGLLSTVGRVARVVFPASSTTVVSSSTETPKAPVEEQKKASPSSQEFATIIGDFHIVEDYKPGNNPYLEAITAKPERSGGVEEEIWISAFDNAGRVLPRMEEKLKLLAFSGGIHPTIRREMWKYLLGYYPWNSTYAERVAIRQACEAQYHVYKTQWTSITPPQEERFRKFRDRKHLIEKDVMRTDRAEKFFMSLHAEEDSNHYDPLQNPNLILLHDILLTYTFFDFDVGYCQGMNDLLAPILVEMQDEVDAFWCFKGLMDRMRPNFFKDQSGMNCQLRRLQGLIKLMDPEFFNYLVSIGADNCHWAFRWILLQFKRELDYDGCKMVWEAIWSAESEHFHLFIVFALVQKSRDHIMMEKLEFDSLLQMCNAMSGKLQYPEVLASATYHYTRWVKAFPEDVKRRVLL